MLDYYKSQENKTKKLADDKAFVDILNKVRDNTIDQQTLDILNSRYIPDFRPQDSESAFFVKSNAIVPSSGCVSHSI